MDSLITQVIAWPTLLACLLMFGFAPGAVLRMIVLAFRRDDPRRAELLAELPNVPRVERPFWVCEQLEVALFEGLAGRLAALIGRMRGGRRRRSPSGRPPGENAVSRYLGRRAWDRTQAAFALAGAGIVVSALGTASVQARLETGDLPAYIPVHGPAVYSATHPPLRLLRRYIPTREVGTVCVVGLLTHPSRLGLDPHHGRIRPGPAPEGGRPSGTAVWEARWADPTSGTGVSESSSSRLQLPCWRR